MANNYASLNEAPDFYGEYAIPHHHVAEPKSSQWNHIEDLDSFFTRVYKYHQMHGFKCIALKEIFALHRFTFIAGITFTMLYAFDYKLLFKPDIPQDDKRIFSLLIPFDTVFSALPNFGWFLLLFMTVIFVLNFIRKVHSLIRFWDIKQFYNQALNIDDADLDNLTWHDVQKLLIEVQSELQMCIHKRDLTELDIYHRILRQINYLVALVNKRLLPPRIDVPVLGEVVYWTENLRLNVMFLLFWSPWGPFENPWHLREEYKRATNREKMARKLGNQILWLFCVNLLLCPLVFITQIIFYFFNYFDVVRREPGQFGVRYWSHFGQLYFRHFNEMDHELYSRLTRAYKPATKYMASFSSPLLAILAEHLSFICGSILTVFVCLSFVDNEILYWNQVLTMLAVLTGIIGIARSLRPDETLIWCPEQLLEAVVLHTHYLPGVWQGLAHTSKVRGSFQQLFQFRFAALIEELLSPILVPYCLIRYIYPRKLDLVDFFRNFTVSVVGVGDVCSFAQMDVRKHGNPDWHAERDVESMQDTPPEVAKSPMHPFVRWEVFLLISDQYTQAEDGKVELSLMHFTNTNPNWQPPPDAADFVDNLNKETNRAFFSDDYAGMRSSMDFGARPDNEDDYPMVVPSQMAFRRSFAGFRSDISAAGAPRRSMFTPRGEVADLFSSAQNMRASTMILHNRHAMNQSVRVVRSAEETTPLLSRR